MNAEQLLAHYERIVDAPGSISKLREFVLALAVQGKLVPQLSDEPSLDQALKASRKDAPQRAAGIRRMRWEASSAIRNAEKRDLPSGWIAARINDTGFYINGLAFKPSDWAEKGVPIIRIQNLTDPTKSFNFAKEKLPDEVVVRDGDILVSWSATLDAFVWERGEGVLNQHIFRVLPDERLTKKNYLHLVLRNAIRELGDGEHARGLVMTHIKRAPFLAHVVGLPPLQEQDRIITKVDELMALCDQLEVARKEREAARELLTAASLARLNAPDPETFVADTRFAIDTLASLTARSEQIKQFRRAILNLAVCGRIAERKPDEGEASTLVESIHADRSQLGHQWLDPDMKLVDFDVPSHWVWQSLDQITTDGPQNGLSPRKSERSDAPKAITLTATTSGRFDGRHFKRVEVKTADASGYWLEPGDLLFQRGNTPDYVGIAAIYDGPTNEFLFPDLIIRVKVSQRMSNRFVHLWCIAPFARKYLTSNATGAQQTMPKINQTTLKATPIAVPPIKEQERIVAEVDALMGLCDQLEASLTSADNTRRRLLDALLHEALSPVAKPSKEHARAAVSGYLVSRLASKRNFGRTAHMKHLYFAESRLGLNLGGRYMREAAGPLDTGIYELEKRAEASGCYTHSVETLPSGNEKVSYQPGKALKAIAEEGITVLGCSRAEMDRLIDIMGGLKTETVEIIATLFAAWNDALIDGQTPDDNWIIKEVREHWHVSKQRFTPADLTKWLGWMRQNDVVPLGHPPRTMQQTTMEF